MNSGRATIPEPLRFELDGLTLREWRDRDAPVLVRAWADPEISAGVEPPATREMSDARRWIEGVGSRRGSRRAVDLAIEVDSPNHGPTVAGEVGLVVVDRARGWAEVGYWLFAAWRGQGLAARSVAELSRWALDSGFVNKLFARAASANVASQAVAYRAGFERVGETAEGITVWVLDDASAAVADP